MNTKAILVMGAIIGTITGTYVPALWGDSSGLSLISLLLGAVGDILGIVLGLKFIQYLDN